MFVQRGGGWPPAKEHHRRGNLLMSLPPKDPAVGPAGEKWKTTGQGPEPGALD